MAVKVKREDFEGALKRGLEVRLGGEPTTEDLHFAQLAYQLGAYLAGHGGKLPAAVINRVRVGRIEFLEALDPTVDVQVDDQVYRVEPGRSLDKGLAPGLCWRAHQAAVSLQQIRGLAMAAHLVFGEEE